MLMAEWEKQATQTTPHIRYFLLLSDLSGLVMYYYYVFASFAQHCPQIQ